MTVRAKFKVDSISSSNYYKQVKDESVPSGLATKSVPIEMRSVKLTPVYSPDPSSENKKFWDTTPEGQIVLGTINPDAWAQFELGKEYFIDFTPAS